MKINIRKSIAFLGMCMLCITMVSGCKKNEEVKTPVPSSSSSVVATPETPETSNSPLETKETLVPQKTKEIPIVALDEESLETKAATVTVPENEKITAKLIVESVVKNFADTQSIKIGIDSVRNEGENVVISFKKGTAPSTGVGSSAEAGILDCISMSVLDNIEECKGVIFRLEGSEYESGHVVLELNEIYNGK